MNYKAGAQAGASTCGRHHPVQTFRFMKFIVGLMIHAWRVIVNPGALPGGFDYPMFSILPSSH